MVLDKEYERVTADTYRAAPAASAPAVRTPGIKPSKSGYTRVAGGLGKRTIALYDLPVSAGTGVYLFDSIATDIAIPDNGKTADADYALRISGDSMEPKYHALPVKPLSVVRLPVIIIPCSSASINWITTVFLSAEPIWNRHCWRQIKVLPLPQENSG